MATFVSDAALTPEAFDLLTVAEKTAYISGMSFLVNSQDEAKRKLLKDFLKSGIMKAEYDAYVTSMGPISMKPMPHDFWFARRIVCMPDQLARDLLDLHFKQVNEKEI